MGINIADNFNLRMPKQKSNGRGGCMLLGGLYDE